VIVTFVKVEAIINVHSKAILPNTHIEVFSRLYRDLAQSEIYLDLVTKDSLIEILPSGLRC